MVALSTLDAFNKVNDTFLYIVNFKNEHFLQQQGISARILGEQVRKLMDIQLFKPFQVAFVDAGEKAQSIRKEICGKYALPMIFTPPSQEISTGNVWRYFLRVGDEIMKHQTGHRARALMITDGHVIKEFMSTLLFHSETNLEFEKNAQSTIFEFLKKECQSILLHFTDGMLVSAKIIESKNPTAV